LSSNELLASRTQVRPLQLDREQCGWWGVVLRDLELEQSGAAAERDAEGAARPPARTDERLIAVVQTTTSVTPQAP
jgi:hypothetical protein